MSKLFATSPFSQTTTYSPLRNSQDLCQDDDDPEPSSSIGGSGHNSNTNSSHRITHFSPQHHPNNNNNYKQFRHRSYSQSSNRSILSMADINNVQGQQHQQHAQPLTFDEGESDIEEKSSQLTSRISTGSSRGVSLLTPSRRGSGNRFLPSGSVLVESAASLSNCEDKLTSPPPKYTSEDLEYSDPSRHSYVQDEENGLGYRHDENNKGDGLLMQASTTLVFAVTGLICAGWLLDVIQHWQVFIDISELIILIPILLNLKGNLEMNLASRLSTAANMGLLDHRESRNAFIKGNLALLQVQSLTVGSVAGLFAFGLGVIVHPTTNNFVEIALMITSSMLCAAMSSLVLGAFMCGLVLICRKYRINPDNIACPLASSFGDLVTLVILAGCSMLLQKIL
ncbi:hypothetical protein BGZ46_008128, partial [Entomortierella lignicola]